MLRAIVNRSILHTTRHGTSCMGLARSFQSAVVVSAAQNFAMPAMSPTMTQGGIIEWKFKEGDSFNSGDVLLEVETDKAQIDVEAPDDGILVKIYESAGAKDIPVGRTIAVIAEPGDDIGSLELPKPEKGGVTDDDSGPVASEPVKDTSANETQSQKTSQNVSGSQIADPNQVLLPSVSGLLASQGISRENALKNIPATGPKGRLLKGDVLVYLGRASGETLSKLDEELDRLSRMDLSNVQIAKPETPSTSEKPSSTKDKTEKTAEKPSAETKAQPTKPTKPESLVLREVFSLTSLKELQDNLQESLNTSISLTKLVDQASKLALKDEKVLSKPKPSVLYDPVFESLISRDIRSKPFDIDIQLPKPTLSHKANTTRSDDIYSALVSPRGFLSSSNTARVDASDLLKVNVTVNEAVPNAKAKAQIYLDRLGYYLSGKGDLLL